MFLSAILVCVLGADYPVCSDVPVVRMQNGVVVLNADYIMEGVSWQTTKTWSGYHWERKTKAYLKEEDAQECIHVQYDEKGNLRRISTRYYYGEVEVTQYFDGRKSVAWVRRTDQSLLKPEG